MRLRLIDGHNHRRHQIYARKHVGLEFLAELGSLFFSEQCHPEVERVVAEDEDRASGKEAHEGKHERSRRD